MGIADTDREQIVWPTVHTRRTVTVHREYVLDGVQIGCEVEVHENVFKPIAQELDAQHAERFVKAIEKESIGAEAGVASDIRYQRTIRRFGVGAMTLLGAVAAADNEIDAGSPGIEASTSIYGGITLVGSALVWFMIRNQIRHIRSESARKQAEREQKLALLRSTQPKPPEA